MLDLQRTLKLVTGALFDAEATWRSWLPDAGNWQKTALILTVPVIVVAMIVAYLLGLVTSGASLLGIRPTLLSTVFSIVGALCAVAVATFIFSWAAGVFGGKRNFELGFAAISLASVPAYAGQALSSLPWIGWLLSLGLAIYSLVLLWRIIPLYLEVPPDKRAAHYVVSLLATIGVFIVISAVLGLGRITGTQSSPFSSVSVTGDTTSESGGGFLGNQIRRAELFAAAQEDRYEPPGDGRLTDTQVREYARVAQRFGEVLEEQTARLAELSERAEDNENPSFSDFAAMARGVADMSNLSTAEMEIVKSNGGNWAEHQWVKETLRTAWLQKDVDDTVAHNYALYQQYEPDLRDFVVR